ncbi:MAG: hypothetical protein HPY90_11415 [Syntrophothermus sp.]|uniref:hypothetical protein n=1 Tax=Syntrophothermus sp. TaxID=2736299 RepID=UPI002580A56D|nr:hypothetical protein [Syntrophothermus sp.]NSW83858.1 hypothetical protein [Syntrophothermus sp.]
MLFGLQLIVNILVFLLLFNLNWLFEKGKNPDYAGGPSSKSVLIPVILGTVLTLLDVLRIQFLVQLAVLAVLAVVLYWVFSIFTRK